jgi:hypothetical protein
MVEVTDCKVPFHALFASILLLPPLRIEISPQAILNTLNLCSFLVVRTNVLHPYAY